MYENKFINWEKHNRIYIQVPYRSLNIFAFPLGQGLAKALGLMNKQDKTPGSTLLAGQPHEAKCPL